MIPYSFENEISDKLISAISCISIKLIWNCDYYTTILEAV